jgi:hypothetical protein
MRDVEESEGRRGVRGTESGYEGRSATDSDSRDSGATLADQSRDESETRFIEIFSGETCSRS